MKTFSCLSFKHLMSSDETEETELLKGIYYSFDHKPINCDKGNSLSAMANNDLETDTSIYRQTSGRRVMRFIPEVTADNLPSRIRLEPRNVGKEANYRNAFLPQDNGAQLAVNKISAG